MALTAADLNPFIAMHVCTLYAGKKKKKIIHVAGGGRGGRRGLTSMWRTDVKIHNTESKLVTGSENAGFAGVVCVYVFSAQKRLIRAWAATEGVKKKRKKEKKKRTAFKGTLLRLIKILESDELSVLSLLRWSRQWIRSSIVAGAAGCR